MKKLLIICLATMFVSACVATDAFAQRDAGAKARGDYGRGFWNRNYTRSYARSYRPTYDFSYTRPTDSYRSFSYAPTAFSVGDHLVVTGDLTKIMMGSTVVGTVPKGTEFTVKKVRDGWLGTVIEVKGTKLSGWIAQRGVTWQTTSTSTAETIKPTPATPVPATPAAPAPAKLTPAAPVPASATPASPRQSRIDAQPRAEVAYQSFSYEPARSSSVQPQQKQPWQYPKGDHRRYESVVK